jgi:5-methylcytosine-specific restriction endonuclease McrA
MVTTPSFSPGRNGAAWRRARAIVLANATTCEICGGALDFEAPPRSRWAPSVDHIVPLVTVAGAAADEQRAVALDPSNLRAVHLGCNSRRGARAKSGARKPLLSAPPIRSYHKR